MKKKTHNIWKPASEEPEGEILIMTKESGYKVGYFNNGYYWYDREYHLVDEVRMWARMRDIEEATGCLECLENYELTK